MFVGITTHIIHGTSGNELPPPAVSQVRTAQLIDVDTIEEAWQIMADKVLPLRRAAEVHCEPYSSPDDYGWEVIKLVD